MIAYSVLLYEYLSVHGAVELVWDSTPGICVWDWNHVILLQSTISLQTEIAN
jgi:hypothetical protein